MSEFLCVMAVVMLFCGVFGAYWPALVIGTICLLLGVFVHLRGR